MSDPRWVYRYDELDAAEARLGGDWDAVRGLLGGKGANLADMTRLGVPVPPGFTITTEACNAYIDADGTMPDGLWDEVLEAMTDLEAKTGKSYGDPDEPAARRLPVGRQVLDAGHDGHRPRHRPQRRGRRRAWSRQSGDARFVLDSLPAPDPDVRHRGARRARRAVRGGAGRAPRRPRSANDAELTVVDLDAVVAQVQADRRAAGAARRSRPTRTSSSASPSRRCSRAGRASGPTTTARRPTSRTTSAPRSTSWPWCSATPAPTRPPVWPCPATPPPARTASRATT